jgi:hypothetical protein
LILGSSISIFSPLVSILSANITLKKPISVAAKVCNPNVLENKSTKSPAKNDKNIIPTLGIPTGNININNM